MGGQWVAAEYWVGSSWWARAEQEPPRRRVRACTRDGCASSTEGPFDLFCGKTGSGISHLVVGDGDLRLQMVAVWALRALCGALVLIAASSGSPVALYVGAGVVGLLVLVLPLREFRIAGVVAPVLWVVALGCAAAAREGSIGATAGEAILLVVAGVLGLALVLAVALHSDAGGPSPEERDSDGPQARVADDDRLDGLALRGVAAALALAAVIGLTCAAGALGLGDLGPAVQRVLLTVCAAALGSAICGSVIAGLLWGVPRVEYRRAYRRPGPFAPRQIPRPKQPRGATSGAFAERLLFTAQWAAVRIATAVVEAGNAIVRLLYRAAEELARVAIRLWHLIRVCIGWMVKLLIAATLHALLTMRAAAGMVLAVGRHWLQTTVASVALLALGALGAVLACSLFSSYVGGATLVDGLAALALAILSACALVAVWWALTKWPADEVAGAALRTGEAAGPTVFLTAVALGWIDGIVGLLGYGPLRPGYLTFAGTIVLAFVLVMAYRNRGPSVEPEPD
jgi:hypothetical protein